jgi:Spy/CpxP family protein refolding chaperone
LIAGSGSPEEIRAKHRQIESYQQQLADLKFESMLATRQVLTPEQRRIFVEQMQRQNKSNKVNKLNIKTTQL